MNHIFCIIGMHTYVYTYVCTVPNTLLTLRWRQSSCCSNIQQCLALETHSAMHGECKQTKTVETTQHRYTCAFSYVHTYIQQFLCGTYVWIQPFSTAIHLTAHMYCTYIRTPSPAHLLAACSTDMFIPTLHVQGTWNLPLLQVHSQMLLHVLYMHGTSTCCFTILHCIVCLWMYVIPSRSWSTLTVHGTLLLYTYKR